jgi:thiamine pyrophosphate-dependent acetolactate synthase large subunit-like protein
LRRIAPDDTIFAGDICQLVYTGAFAMPVAKPKLWHYPAGFCTLGCGLPNGIGAKLALPDSPVAVLTGDGGFMFTAPELVSAAELRLPLPIVIWENGGYKQIEDDMRIRDIPPVGVNGINPDFVKLAAACGCFGRSPATRDAFEEAFLEAMQADRPTVILVREGRDWLA